MATSSLNYASSAAITCTTAGLASGGYRSSAAISNTTNLYLDALVSGSIEIDTPTNDGHILVFAYASVDGGTVYSGGLDGTDATITWGTTPSTSSVFGYMQIVPLGAVSVASTDDGNDLEFGPFSVASAFGGILPNSWGIVIENDTDTTFDATGTNNTLDYVGVKFDTA